MDTEKILYKVTKDWQLEFIDKGSSKVINEACSFLNTEVIETGQKHFFISAINKAQAQKLMEKYFQWK